MRRFLFSALRHFRWSVAAFVGVGITQTLIGLLSIVYLQKLLDAIPTVRTFSDLGGVFLIYALLCAVNYGLSYLEEYPHRILDYGIYQWAKVVSIKKIARIDYLAYQNLGTGKLIQVIEHGADATKKILFDFYLRIIRELLPGIVFSLLLIGIYSHTIMFILLGGYIVVFAISHVLLKYLHAKKEKILTHEEHFARFSVRGFMELVVFRINTRFKREIDRLEAISNDIVKSKAQVRMIHELFFVLFAYLVFAIQLGVIYMQTRQIIAGTSTIGTLVALMQFVQMVYQPIAIFNVLYVDYKLDTIAFRRFHQFLTLPDDRNWAKTNAIAVQQGEIELRDIAFAYHDAAIIQNFSVHLAGQSSVALVGTTGSGKSTLAKLILALLKPTSGAILVDGQNLAEVKLESYYGQIAYLSQDAPIFDGTVRENVIFDQHVDDQDILDIFANVCLDQWITALPHGLDTEIGERGIKLSGGEKQRLAFARIFFQNPQIIVLDEPTSALDSTTEEVITTNMLDLFRHKTVIIIAHRLQTIRNVDRILVLEAGRIVQDGSFEQLVNVPGRFKELWDTQTQNGSRENYDN